MAEEKDIPIVESPSRDNSPNGIAATLSSLYQSLLLTQKYDRQARGALVALTTVTVPAPVSQLAINVTNPPTEAEVQAIHDRLNEVIVKQTEILTILEFIKEAMDSNLQTLN